MAMETIREMGRKAREASRAMATATPAAKTEFLYALARLLMDRRKEGRRVFPCASFCAFFRAFSWTFFRTSSCPFFSSGAAFFILP